MPSINTVNDRIQKLSDRIEEESLWNNDPWNGLITTSTGKCELLKADFAKEYKVKVTALPCMISGLIPLSNQKKPNLRLTHIFPRSTKNHILTSLGLEASDIDNFKNMLLLCSGFEEAFYKHHISFIPNNNPFSNGFIVKFWKDEFKDAHLYPWSIGTIGTYDGAPLNLVVNGRTHVVFRRVLSYHAFMSFIKWKKDLSNITLPNNCDLSIHEDSYNKTWSDYLLQIKKDIDSDEIENEELNGQSESI
eukprot:gene19731-25661_t